MLAVVKTPHIDIRMNGDISPVVIKTLREVYGDALKLETETSEEELSVFDSELYKEFEESVTPGDYVKIYRENLGLTQIELGKKLGTSRSYICDIEHNRRAISKEKAKVLARIFGVPVGRFI